MGNEKPLTRKLNIEIDFGHNYKLWKTSDTKLIDENGKNYELNGMVDAMNFMSKHGYEFVTSYVFSRAVPIEYHYLLWKVRSK